MARNPTRNRFVRSSSNDSLENVIGFTLRDSYERVMPVYDALCKYEGLNTEYLEDAYYPGVWNLELFSSEASKGAGTLFVKDICGFENVVGFGDNLNDLSLLDACDIGIAMQNSVPELISIADIVCGSNNEDGVVKWIETNYKKSGKNGLQFV